MENLASGRELQIILAFDMYPVDQRLKAFIPNVFEVVPRYSGVGFAKGHKHTAGSFPERKIQGYGHRWESDNGVGL